MTESFSLGLRPSSYYFSVFSPTSLTTVEGKRPFISVVKAVLSILLKHLMREYPCLFYNAANMRGY